MWDTTTVGDLSRQKQVQKVVEQKIWRTTTYTSTSVENVGAIPDSLFNLLTADGHSSPFAPKSTQTVEKCAQYVFGKTISLESVNPTSQIYFAETFAVPL